MGFVAAQPTLRLLNADRWAMSGKWKLAAVVSLVLLVSMTNLGCRDYKKFSLNKGIARFSFEYPSAYELESTRMESYFAEEISVFFYTSPTKQSIADYHNAEIFVNIGEASAPIPTLQERTELAIASGSRHYGNFRLLERSNVEFAGIRGELVVFSFASYLLEDVQLGMHLVNTPAISRAVYFDRNGQIWLISLTAHESLADKSKADFTRILQTFKFLD